MTKAEIKERYFMDTDNDSHWYIIPKSKEGEWWEWLEIPSDDERSWEAPAFAEMVGGAYTNVTFENYKIGEV